MLLWIQQVHDKNAVMLALAVVKSPLSWLSVSAVSFCSLRVNTKMLIRQSNKKPFAGNSFSSK